MKVVRSQSTPEERVRDDRSGARSVVAAFDKIPATAPKASGVVGSRASG